MDEEEIVAPASSPQLTAQEQMAQYGMLAAYFAAVYLFCYLLCRLIKWERVGRAAGAIQGLLLIAGASAIYWFWGLRFARLEEEHDLIKAFGIAFVTLLVAIGGSAHGEYGRSRKLARLAPADTAPEEIETSGDPADQMPNEPT